MVKTPLPLQGPRVWSLAREVSYALRFGKKKKGGGIPFECELQPCLPQLHTLTSS